MTIDKNSKIIIIVFLMVVMFVTWYNCPPKTLKDKKKEGFSEISSKSLTTEFMNQQIFFKMFIYATLHHQPNNDSMLNQVFESQKNIANIICSKYKSDKYKDLHDLLKSHIISLSNMVFNMRDDDIDRNRSDYIKNIHRQSISKLYINVERMCVLLNEITGKDYETLNKALTKYYKYMFNSIKADSHGFFEEDVANTIYANESLSEIINIL